MAYFQGNIFEVQSGVVIGGTKYESGEPDEQPVREVEIARPFSFGLNEVTFKDWAACVAGGGCAEEPDDNGWGRGDQLVANVTWQDARGYAAWLSHCRDNELDRGPLISNNLVNPMKL